MDIAAYVAFILLGAVGWLCMGAGLGLLMGAIVDHADKDAADDQAHGDIIALPSRMITPVHAAQYAEEAQRNHV